MPIPAGMINCVQIQNALLIPITANFIIDKLKFKPTKSEKRASYWLASDYPKMCDALLRWIEHQKRIDLTKLSGERPRTGTPTPTEAPHPGQAAPFVTASDPFAVDEDPFAPATGPVADVSSLF